MKNANYLFTCLLLLTFASCANHNTKNEVSKVNEVKPARCDQVDIKESLGFFIGKGMGTKTKEPAITAKDIEFIEVTDSHAPSGDFLSVNFTADGKKKMRALTKANMNQVLLVKNGDQILAAPFIKGEIDNGIISPASGTTALGLLRSLCKRPL